MTIGNPFPAAAVARLSELPDGPLTIATPAIRQALAYVDDYLAAGRGDDAEGGKPGKPGNVIAVVGEYGTGKTHLALEILRHIRRVGGTSVQRLYLDAPADTFLALYQQRFVVELSKADVRDQVEEYFADIVAGSLAGSELTAEAARRLRDREIDAQAVIDRLGLMESAFLQALQEHLRVVTENDAFGTALALFRRAEFEDAVWEWLKGHPPDPALVERGITAAIDDDAAALEAIGVFAFLCGRRNQPFVLVIDELEKVLSPPHLPAADSVLAFKKLLEVFSGARALLVLSGLPDFLEALPDDARQRIGCVVRPSALSTEDTRGLILDSQERAFGKRTLDPFSEETLGYLVELAGGTARKVIKLCYHSYQSAVAAGTGVTQAMIREAAREQFELTSRDDVRAEVTRVLDRGGWLFEAGHVSGDGVRADFWVPQGDGGAGCAILITDSVLTRPEANVLAERARRLRAGAGRGVLLVVNGYLADHLAPALTAVCDRPPLVHSLRRFTDDFDAALRGVMQRLEAGAREDELKALRDRVDRLSRQQARGFESLLDELKRERRRSAEEPSPRRPTYERTDTFHFPDTGVPSPGGSAAGQELPDPVEREFGRALSAVDTLNTIAAMLKAAAGPEPSPVRIGDREVLAAVGAGAVLQIAVQEFRSGVAEWFSTMGPLAQRNLTGMAELCRGYQDVYLALPVRRLVRLADIQRRVSPELIRTTPVQDDPDYIALVLGSLADRVYVACQESTKL
ncbi:hypothetical protein SMC26_24560 [Actinomadura fulvescens]|uniref:AAA+ ATPase domain-containing protein n=1 Tax=Actinomadura fulvescens TaxID=46160 RepID=A0ABN3Q0J7_9ACTN